MELADATDDPAQRQARCTFVMVGAGYTGTEMAAQGQLFTRAALRRFPRIRPDELRWLLVDRAPAILPELGQRLGDPALRILRRRGLDVRLNTTIEEVTDSQVRLSDGTSVPTEIYRLEYRRPVPTTWPSEAYSSTTTPLVHRGERPDQSSGQE